MGWGHSYCRSFLGEAVWLRSGLSFDWFHFTDQQKNRQCVIFVIMQT